MKFESQLHYLNQLPPSDELVPGGVFVYDQGLLNLEPKLTTWLEDVKLAYPVKAGEELKDIHAFPKHIENLLDLVDRSPQAKPSLVAVGGGSLGDFTGFAASCLKRGLGFVQIPTTLLAAVDSAHGGKTALNVRGAKNQIGSFYPARDVYIIKDFLKQLPLQQREDSFGELFKMGLLSGGALWTQLKEVSDLELDTLWELLPGAVEGKYGVIERDPYEMLGIRQCLNLGHTMGHVWEVACGLSHGKAVAQGIDFALAFSREKAFLSDDDDREIRESGGYRILKRVISALNIQPLPRKQVEDLLRRDKKRAGENALYFIFVNRPGSYQSEAISYDELLDEAGRQGFVAS